MKETRLPSIQSLLETKAGQALTSEYGRTSVLHAVREVVAQCRAEVRSGLSTLVDPGFLIQQTAQLLERLHAIRLKPVLNLTGTVLHTNLGRAPLPKAAVDAILAVSSGASNLEYDLETGKRGDRDDHMVEFLCRITGAKAATIVNNNAAALLLVLNTLALRKEVLVSRGELIEIGDSFRLPDIMTRAGCRLREVGTTNCTHIKDFAEAITPKTALILKVHASNYRIDGFTAAPPDRALSKLAHDAGLPYAVDLGSGSLSDLSKFGLPREPMPQDALIAGADLVTFSGDKLLGGPQAGLIVGQRDLVARLKRNPLKRALRCDKLTIAALAAILTIYADESRLPSAIPALRLLARSSIDIGEAAERIAPKLSAAVHEFATVDVIACMSQIGSGALPTDVLPSAALCITPASGPGHTRISAQELHTALRSLPVPVIGRVRAGAVLLDCRCLERDDEAVLLAQLFQLADMVKSRRRPS